MHIQWIQFSDFRNYRTLSYTPAPTLNVLTGPNAQGKTNLLEGLAVLLMARSFRASRPVEWPRWESSAATVWGELCRAESSRVLRRVISQRPDGAWVVDGDGCPWARVIPFGWQDLGILNGAPQARRNFLDGFAAKLFPAHLRAHARYRQILSRRNHLLQAGADGAARLRPWDEQLARVGLELLARRRTAVAALQRELERLFPELAGRASLVRLGYRSSLGEDASEARFLEDLAARRREEMRRGQTLVGPHRDDLMIELDGRDMRTYGSRGQQRLLALALRLAETGPVRDAVGSPPVLLLDDALSELDPVVQANVLRVIEGAGQVFLTTAAAAPAAGYARRWEVRGGGVTDLRLEPVRGAA